MANDIISLAPSQMDFFYKCPARYGFSLRYRTPFIQAFADGSDAHAIVKGEQRPDASDRAKAYANTFLKVIETWDFKMIAQEFPMEWWISPTVKVSGIIDALATMHGVPILIDWKTSSGLEYWNLEVTDAKTERGVTKINTKAASFQGKAYLIPPAEERIRQLGLESWPNTIYFVIGDYRGNANVIPYSYSEHDAENFIQSAKFMAAAIRNDIYPEVRGEACGIGTPIVCPFLDVCYKRRGWESKYKEKSNGR